MKEGEKRRVEEELKRKVQEKRWVEEELAMMAKEKAIRRAELEAQRLETEKRLEARSPPSFLIRCYCTVIHYQICPNMMSEFD